MALAQKSSVSQASPFVGVVGLEAPHEFKLTHNVESARALAVDARGEHLYKTLTTRIMYTDREMLKEMVKKLSDQYASLEDLLEDIVYRFIVDKPYATGYIFQFPLSVTAPIRGTDQVRRTGWVQLNVYANNKLADLIKQEVKTLQKYNHNISQAAYLYTALKWALQYAPV